MFKKSYKNLFKFKKYYKKEQKLINRLIIVMIIASSMGMLLPYFFSQRLINITILNAELVFKFSIIIMIIISIHHLNWYLWEKLASLLTNKVSLSIRNDLTYKMLNTTYFEIKSKTSGYYLERLNDDVFTVSSFLANILGTLIDTLTNFSFLGLIYILNFKSGLIFTIGIIILYIIDSIRINKEVKYIEKLKILNEKYSSKINENYKGIKDIKCLGIKNQIYEETNYFSSEISMITIKMEKTIALYNRIKTYLQYVLELILIIYSVYVLIPNNKLSIVVLLMIIDYSGFMYELIGFIAKIKEQLIKGELKASRLLEILENQNIDQFGNAKNKIKNNFIDVHNLSYSYPDEPKKKVLKNISFEIKENTSNIFIGSSGSGKSTLFGILTKLFEIENGKVLIGNRDINDFTEEDLREKIFVVNQEIFMLNDSILNNIKIVKPKSSLNEIISVCKKANIYEEIINLKEGFNTLITENGNNLSGGQKQRIAIARSILKNCPILLFDEPTSALDINNQKKFIEIINTLKKEKTILIITHKFENLESIDNVFELRNGLIVNRR